MWVEAVPAHPRAAHLLVCERLHVEALRGLVVLGDDADLTVLAAITVSEVARVAALARLALHSARVRPLQRRARRGRATNRRASCLTRR